MTPTATIWLELPPAPPPPGVTVSSVVLYSRHPVMTVPPTQVLFSAVPKMAAPTHWVQYLAVAPVLASHFPHLSLVHSPAARVAVASMRVIAISLVVNFISFVKIPH